MSEASEIEQLQESVAAAAQLVVELQKENEGLTTSLRTIKDIKFHPAFGELNFCTHDEWASEALSKAESTIRREMMKHRIY